jgi:hypothetical protein
MCSRLTHGFICGGVDGFTDAEKTATVLANRARVLMRLHRWADAVRDLKEAGVGATAPHGHRDATLVWDLGRALFLGGQLEESVQAHRQLLTHLEQVLYHPLLCIVPTPHGSFVLCRPMRVPILPRLCNGQRRRLSSSWRSSRTIKATSPRPRNTSCNGACSCSR